MVITEAAAGRAFLLTLRRDPTLGPLVRSLRVTPTAYRGGLFDDLVADDIIRFCTLLTSLDTAIGAFGPLADGRASLASFPPTLRHFRVAMTAYEAQQDENDEQETQETDDEDDGDASMASAPPPVLARLGELPAATSSLIFDQLDWIQSLDMAAAPSTSFPLAFLRDVEFSLVTNSASSPDFRTRPRWPQLTI